MQILVLISKCVGLIIGFILIVKIINNEKFYKYIIKQSIFISNKYLENIMMRKYILNYWPILSINNFNIAVNAESF